MTNAQYVVIGNPIAHSKSPLIHTNFAQQTQQALNYETLLVDTKIGAFQQAIADFQKNNGKGCNITVPFKQEAWQLATQRQPRAEKAGAVNTLWFEQGRIIGDNTDGVGLVRDLVHNHQCQITGKRLLILGAGGAVRGVLSPLLAEKPTQCVIANRTVSKAETLAEIFADEGKITPTSFTALAGQQFDIIINGTSASLQGELPPLPDNMFAKNAWAYDMMYGAKPTPFMTWATQHGATQILDGLGMLVEQAAESFYLWRGVRPKTQPIIELVRSQL